MARNVEVTLIDDLDGGVADTVVRFSLDGKNYEIDLSNANAVEFRASMARYIEAARKAGSTRSGSRGARAKSADDKPSTAEVRAWARHQGIQVPDRGRVSKELVVQFQEAKA